MTISDRFIPQTGYTENVSFVTVRNDGSKEDISRTLLREHHLTVFINETRAMEIACTPTHLPFLVTGRLISEGLISGADDINILDICEKGLNAKVFLKEGCGIKTTDLINVQSCCNDNKNFVTADRGSGAPGISDPTIMDNEIFTPEDIFRLISHANKDMKLHRETSGTHSCYLYHEGEVIFSCEDIGRHNALDKVIGKIYLDGLSPERCAVFTTGRTPLDMVRKGIRARLGVLVSKSVPTYDAVMLAKEYGLKLYSRAWPDSYEKPHDLKFPDIGPNHI